MLSFCTLFDSYYLDKGIALFQSLEAVSSDFILYTFCFDDKSYEVLKKINYSRMVVLHHGIFETQELLKIKATRSKAEYCWTCTPVVIEYVLENFNIDNCTYLDADLYFYTDPQILYDEIEDADADVAIVEHRFKNNRYGRRLEKRNGKYCVQFNFFKKTEQALEVLKHWKEQCFDWCYDIPEADRMGDQKYLNSWTSVYTCVHELQYLGGGVAPWNLEQYSLVDMNEGNVVLRDSKKQQFKLVFYHFQNIRYLGENFVNIKSQTTNKKLKYAIYIPYLKKIEEIRKNLFEQYGISFIEKGVIRSSNHLLGFLQKHFSAFKIQSISDVIRLDCMNKYLR